MSDQDDLEAPDDDVFEQSLPVEEDEASMEPVEHLPDDPEAPEPDTVEQHQPAPVVDDDWR